MIMKTGVTPTYPWNPFRPSGPWELTNLEISGLKMVLYRWVIRKTVSVIIEETLIILAQQTRTKSLTTLQSKYRLNLQ